MCQLRFAIIYLPSLFAHLYKRENILQYKIKKDFINNDKLPLYNTSLELCTSYICSLQVK